VQYAWIQQQHTEFSVRRRCRLLEVSRSGYYAWLQRPPSAPTAAEQQGEATVQPYFAQGRSTYGTRRIKHLLAQAGLHVSRRRIGRVLAQAGLPCKTRRKCKAPTAAGQAQTVAPNQRNRAFTGDAPDKVYVGDIPSLPTGEGWLSLAVVLVLCSRAVSEPHRPITPPQVHYHVQGLCLRGTLVRTNRCHEKPPAKKPRSCSLSLARPYHQRFVLNIVSNQALELTGKTPAFWPQLTASVRFLSHANIVWSNQE
jgi:hypothetical protein